MLPIPGTSQVKHLEENVAAASVSLTEEEFQALDEQGQHEWQKQQVERPEYLKNAEIMTALEHVQALQQAIPGIVSIQVGENLNDRNQGHTYGFVMQFANTERLKAFGPHPAHRSVSEEVRRICQSIIAFDIADQ